MPLHLIRLAAASFLLLSCASQQEDIEGKHPVKGVCRSCKPHMIRGVWYTPQLFYDYDELAIASWYGPGFHGKPNANGQIYDKHGVSAAHKTLPLPTVVRVTNLENGKTIDLVVDDRGPYVDGRIIDLSVGAAKEIGMYMHGTAKVRVQSLPEHSQALSLYLARHGNRWGVVRGRTWTEIYNEEIAGKHPAAPYVKGNNATPSFVPGHGADKGEIVPISYEVKEAAPVKKQEELDELVERHAEDAPEKEKACFIKNCPKVQEKPPTSKRPAPQKLPTPSYSIQMASFINSENAHKLKRELNSVAPSHIQETVVPPGQKFYAVRCGPYPSKDAAIRAMANLGTFGHNPQLVQE